MTNHPTIERLLHAVNEHDLEGVVACFAPDFRNETPAHPGRGFSGREQVRANWGRIFAGLPDIVARVPRAAIDGDVVWTEWEMAGTLPNGIAQVLRGVIIFGSAGDELAWCRFYLEPVDNESVGVDGALDRFAGAPR